MADTQHFVFYNYTPSLAAGVIFCGLFLIFAAYQIYLLATKRTWYFIPFIIGCLFEGIGYIGRIIASKEAPDFTQNPYILQSTLLLLGPNLFAASVYMVLGRIIVFVHGEHFSLIKPKWLTKIFVAGDVISFLVQGGGDGILVSAKSQDSLDLANNIVLAGLAVQVIFFALFITVGILFHLRIRASPTAEAVRTDRPWEQLLFVLYASSLMIMIRNIYRIAEYAGGSSGELQMKEVYFYIFDGLMMASATVLFSWFHPSKVISREALGQSKLYSTVNLADVQSEAHLNV